MAIESIHPFPARMAAEIALGELAALPRGSLVLDPMAGSGTVLRVAAELGHRGWGFDVDPLAVLMARVWTTPVDTQDLRQVVRRASRLDLDAVSLPWLDQDDETRRFVEYWFGSAQRADLRRLSSVVHSIGGVLGDALRLVLSKIIITKDRGASLARDVSHSRPHRVWETSDFLVNAGFLRAANRLATQLEKQPPPGGVAIAVGDARDLTGLTAGSIDAVVTSPPYLNAIDYLRGHRLALVWLGHRVGDLRTIRAESIGSERAARANADVALTHALRAPMGTLDGLPARMSRMIDRYVLDVYHAMREVQRVLRPGGQAVLVVGNSCLAGVYVENAASVLAAAEQVGLRLVRRHERALPPARRYLPPPASSVSGLQKRLRTETVLTFIRP